MAEYINLEDVVKHTIKILDGGSSIEPRSPIHEALTKHLAKINATERFDIKLLLSKCLLAINVLKTMCKNADLYLGKEGAVNLINELTTLGITEQYAIDYNEITQIACTKASQVTTEIFDKQGNNITAGDLELKLQQVFIDLLKENKL